MAVNGFKVTGIYPFNRYIFTDADFLDESQSLSTKQTNEQSGPSTTSESSVISPQDISSIPEQKTRTSNQKRKSTTATVSTGSPYKKKLEDSIKRIEKAKRGCGRGRGHGRASIVEAVGMMQDIVKSQSRRNVRMEKYL